MFRAYAIFANLATEVRDFGRKHPSPMELEVDRAIAYSLSGGRGPRGASQAVSLLCARPEVMDSIVAACDIAEFFLKHHEHEYHDEWEEWVALLTEAMKKRGLPIGAGEGNSPFVALVRQIQKTMIPREACRLSNSPDALAQRIKRARRRFARYLAGKCPCTSHDYDV